MNSPVLPPQKLIVPREFSLQLGFNLFPVLWVHIFVVYSCATKLVAYEPFRSLSPRRKCHVFKAAEAFKAFTLLQNVTFWEGVSLLE